MGAGELMVRPDGPRRYQVKTQGAHMALYGITHVRINPNNNRISHARWGQIDGAANEWIGQLEVVEAHEVGNALVFNDVVYSIHTIQDGNTVPGAKARYMVYANGEEGFDTLEPENHPGRTFRDLPTI
jgi:hypothetical protein